MDIDLELQFISEETTLPHPAQFKEWISLVLDDKFDYDIELTIRIVDEAEIKALNLEYRKKNKSTNVLAFVGDIDEGLGNYLGDIVVCAPVLASEAEEQGKDLISHWAHIVIHGILHLLGFDHKNEKEANEMEGVETQLLLELGFAAPYRD